MPNFVFAQAAHNHEHMQILNLVKYDEVTHTAITDGSWFAESTWDTGGIPGINARVLVPEGVTVVLDEVSNEPLNTVRIDGKLIFAYWKNTKILVDTIVVSQTGELQVGSAEFDFHIDKTADIVFARNGDIDLDWDPMLLSRGLIALGKLNIHGAKKDSFIKILDDPSVGDTSLTLSKVPFNWRVGDKLVLTGTHKRGFDTPERWAGKSYKETEDEVIYINAIRGNIIDINRPLEYDHDTPDESLKAYIANLTRSVTFSNEGRGEIPVHHRGHVMLHDPSSAIYYAAFDELGRTDKSFRSTGVSFLDSVSPDANVQGRYPLHIHKAGNQANRQNPVRLIGNAVNGSPGWGVVQHRSNALFVDNVVFNAFGAAYVAESGNDVGNWLRNIAIKSKGIAWGIKAAIHHGRVKDVARSGDGFFFNSRLVQASENVAANTTHGYTYVVTNRLQPDGLPPNLLTSYVNYPEIARGRKVVSPEVPTLSEFRDNEAFGNMSGFLVARANPSQGTGLRSLLKRFTAWEVVRGITARYSPHYTVVDLRVFGSRTEHVNSSLTAGIVFERKSFDWTINRAAIKNFDIGINASGHDEGISSDNRVGANFIDITFQEVSQEYNKITEEGHSFYSSADLKPGRLGVRYPSKLGPLGKNSFVYLDWILADSLGLVSSAWEFDRPRFSFEKGAKLILRDHGYYQLPSGENAVIIEEIMADRATAEMLKIVVPIPLDESVVDLSPYRDRGLLSFAAPAPIAEPDVYVIAADEPAVLDVTVNDYDPDGGGVFISGIIHPERGEVLQLETGQLRYVPDPGFKGVDSFSYWLRDEEGNISQGEVAVRVGPGEIPVPGTVERGDLSVLYEEISGNIQPIAAQNREVFRRGATRITFDPLENDFDGNGDELFLRSVIRSGGIAAIDIRLDAQGVVTSTTTPEAAGFASFLYTINDGALRGGDDMGIMPIFIGRNNAPNPEFAERYKGRANLTSPFKIDIHNVSEDLKIESIQHTKTYHRNEIGDLQTIVVESDSYDIGSVAFYLDGELVTLDNVEPFALYGYDGGKFLGSNIPAGEHLLRVVATREDNGHGHFQFESRVRFVVSDALPDSIMPVSEEAAAGELSSTGLNLVVDEAAAGDPSISLSSVADKAVLGGPSSAATANDEAVDFEFIYRERLQSDQNPPIVSFQTLADGDTTAFLIPNPGVNVYASDSDAGSADGDGIRWVHLVLTDAETGQYLDSRREYQSTYDWGLKLRKGGKYRLTAFAVATREAGGGWSKASIAINAE